MVIPCEKVQRSEAACKTYNRACSELTRWVIVFEETGPQLCRVFKVIERDQLRFLGSILSTREFGNRSGFL